MSDTVECAFCDRTHELRVELAQLLKLARTAGAVADIGSEGWRIYLTGSDEPTVICDRCGIIYDRSAAAIAAGIDQVAAARHPEGPPLMLTHVGIPARGTRRRLQALCARGFSIAELARHLNTTRANVSALLHHPEHVFPDTDQRIRDLYNRLWNQSPPPDDGSFATIRTINRARRLGWAPPMAWDDIDTDAHPARPKHDPDLVDDVAVALALAGHRVKLHTNERELVVRALHARGLHDAQIAEYSDCTDRQVTRIRERLELPGNFVRDIDPQRAADAAARRLRTLERGAA